jgi:hypothetical protein
MHLATQDAHLLNLAFESRTELNRISLINNYKNILKHNKLIEMNTNCTSDKVHFRYNITPEKIYAPFYFISRKQSNNIQVYSN